MQPQQIKQFLTTVILWLLLKSKRIMKNTAPNHNTIHTVLLSELEAGLTVRDIPVYGQKCIWCHLITKFLNPLESVPNEQLLYSFLLLSADEWTD
ncbi:hypothetical protein D3C78_1432110 [compost metagenome]